MSSRFRNVLFAVAGTLIAVVGCTDTGTLLSSGDTAHPAARLGRGTTAASTTETTFASNGSDLTVLAQFRQKPQITIAWAKAWIGPEGGRLDFQGFSIVVPAGAVDKVTMFSIRLPVDPDGSERVVAEFGPHGAQFKTPVTLGFPYRGTTIEGNANAHVVWWNNAWVDMGGWISPDGSQVLTQTPHFSEMGTTATRQGGLTASGG